jgi:hypothetical protein
LKEFAEMNGGSELNKEHSSSGNRDIPTHPSRGYRIYPCHPDDTAVKERKSITSEE